MFFRTNTGKLFSTKLGTKHLWVKGIQSYFSSHELRDNNHIAKVHWRNLKIFFSKTKAPVMCLKYCECSVKNFSINQSKNKETILTNSWHKASFCKSHSCLYKWRTIDIMFFAHLSWKLKWAFLIVFRPSSVRLSVCL